MRVTALKIGLALAALAGTVFADAHSDVVDLFASMTSALSEDVRQADEGSAGLENAAGFLRPFDRKMAGYDELNRNVKALLLDSEVSSSVDFLKDEGDDLKRSVDVDWYLELRSRQPDGGTRTRREILHFELVKEKKRWRVASFSPVSFFKP